MRVCSLASGSKGNCIYIDNGDSAILIDNGITLRELKARLIGLGLDIAKIKAVLVTHEHGDHIKGVGVLSRNLGVKVYSPHECYDKICAKVGYINYAGENRNYESGFTVGEFDIAPFRTPHDSLYSVGYRVTFDGKTVAVATDLGKVANGVFNHLLGSDLVILEANHDVSMLMSGNYPYPLKQRIMSSNGHLSNIDMANAVAKLASTGVNKFVLAHLSAENNTSSLACDSALSALKSIGAAKGDVSLEVATQCVPTKIYDL